MLDIINKLLDFSRIESGQISLHVEQTALLPLIDRAMYTIQGPGKRKGLMLRTTVSGYIPLLIDMDATRVRQILVNLLGNAVKFTDNGGITLSVTRTDNKLIFAVCDSGKAIASADRDAVFTPLLSEPGKHSGDRAWADDCLESG